MKQLPLHAFFNTSRCARPDASERRKFVDFFCGCGGASQGALQAGYDVVLAVDSCRSALAVHKRNHRLATHICAELPAPFALPLPSAEDDWHLHGSPPCTHLSQANIERDPNAKADAVKVVEWFVEFALASTASSWTMENVATKPVIALLERLRTSDAANRSKIAYTIVQCHEHGLPTTRRRLVAGSPKAIAAFLRLAPVHRTVRSVIERPRGTHARTDVVWAGSREYKYYGPDDACHSIDGTVPCITARHTLFWATPGKGVPLVKMTSRETATVQSFPENYQLDPLVANAIRQLGNAFPPCVAERLFACCV